MSNPIEEDKARQRQRKIDKIDIQDGSVWNTIQPQTIDNPIAFMLYCIYERMGDFLRRDIERDE